MLGASANRGRTWDRRGIWRILILTGLSLCLPPLLRHVEMRLAAYLAPQLEGTGIFAPDLALLLVGAFGVVIALSLKRPYIGLSIRGIRFNRYTAGLVLLVLLPSIVTSDGVLFTPDFVWLTTAIAEEIICRGLWFGVAIIALGLDDRDVGLVSAPVLLSSLFFVVWHIPIDSTWPGWGFAALGIYKAVTLGLLRAYSGSLYPCILVHVAKLAL